jgi:arsenite/tail-anchored protein-transporting ATPase
MKVRDIIHSRLIFVSGKGGVGKTCVSAAIGKTSASTGKKVLLVEVDNFHASFPSIFNRNIGYQPCELEPNLFGCNITWMKALEDWLMGTVRVRAIVQMILKNRVAMLFLNATPGAREIVILSKIADLLDQYDQVIVDLPASGHALGILRVPGTAIELMRSGPIYERAKQILTVFAHPRAMVLLCALPEEMVVNETVEFAEKIKADVPQIKNLGVVVNRVSVSSFNQDETTLLAKLSDAITNQSIESSEARNMVESAMWDQELEVASARSLKRLNAELGYDVLSLPKLGLLGGFGGGTPKVVQQMTTIFSRKFRMEQS